MVLYGVSPILSEKYQPYGPFFANISANLRCLVQVVSTTYISSNNIS